MMSDAIDEALQVAEQAWDTLFDRIVDVVKQHFTASSLATEHGCTCRVTSVRRIVSYTYLVQYHVDLPLRFFESGSPRPHTADIAHIFDQHGGTFEGVEIVVKRGNDGQLVVLETIEITRESDDEQ